MVAVVVVGPREGGPSLAKEISQGLMRPFSNAVVTGGTEPSWLGWVDAVQQEQMRT